jgi:type IV pilus assembly protein PilA
MTTSSLRPQMQTALMRQLSQSSNRKKNLLQQGFTLVELMIVIVIVGILSAVALPNFLNQTSKAKATECTTKLGSILSQAGAEALSGDSAAVNAAMTTLATDSSSGLCTFTSGGINATTGIYTASVVGAGDLASKYNANGCVNPATGKKDVNISASSTTATAASCT